MNSVTRLGLYYNITVPQTEQMELSSASTRFNSMLRRVTEPEMTTVTTACPTVVLV